VTKELAYRRVVLKISGEAFCKQEQFGISSEPLEAFVKELLPVYQQGLQMGIVVGAGNFFRGRDLVNFRFLRRTTADAMGMLATVINALALVDALTSKGINASAFSAIEIGRYCRPYRREEAIEKLNAGHVVILAGGTGNPFFTTDTCAALRAAELDADALFKATKVDGVFDGDPIVDPNAKKFDRITYSEMLSKQLAVMDLAAISLCMNAKIPVIVFKMDIPGNLLRVATGEPIGTIIEEK